MGIAGKTGNNAASSSLKKVVTFSIRCTQGPAAVERVNGFVDSCYAWYRNELARKVDHSRYMYVLTTKTSTSRTAQEDDADGAG